MMRHFFLMHFTAFSILTGSQALAQSRFPEFMLTPDFQMDEPVIAEKDRVSINLQNRLMRDIITLQDQINLLESLVERQAEIQKIAENYEDLGLPYKQPPPPQNACQNLPTNVLCLFFYPDMDNNKALLQEAEQRIQERQQQFIMDSLAQYELYEGDLGSLDSPPNTSLDNMHSQPRNQFAWADIQCLRSECSALIVSTADQERRFRVNTGDTINESVTIKSISPLGVTAHINDKEQELMPLAVIEENERELQSINEIIEANRPNSSFPENPAQDTSFQGETQSEGGGQLGPTGLF